MQPIAGDSGGTAAGRTEERAWANDKSMALVASVKAI